MLSKIQTLSLINFNLFSLKISKGENSSVLLHIYWYVCLCIYIYFFCVCVVQCKTAFIIKNSFAAANHNLLCFKSNYFLPVISPVNVKKRIRIFFTKAFQMWEGNPCAFLPLLFPRLRKLLQHFLPSCVFQVCYHSSFSPRKQVLGMCHG